MPPMLPFCDDALSVAVESLALAVAVAEVFEHVFEEGMV